KQWIHQLRNMLFSRACCYWVPSYYLGRIFPFREPWRIDCFSGAGLPVPSLSLFNTEDCFGRRYIPYYFWFCCLRQHCPWERRWSCYIRSLLVRKSRFRQEIYVYQKPLKTHSEDPIYQ